MTVKEVNRVDGCESGEVSGGEGLLSAKDRILLVEPSSGNVSIKAFTGENADGHNRFESVRREKSSEFVWLRGTADRSGSRAPSAI
jgi:hypothetical protein